MRSLSVVSWLFYKSEYKRSQATRGGNTRFHLPRTIDSFPLSSLPQSYRVQSCPLLARELVLVYSCYQKNLVKLKLWFYFDSLTQIHHQPRKRRKNHNSAPVVQVLADLWKELRHQTTWHLHVTMAANAFL